MMEILVTRHQKFACWSKKTDHDTRLCTLVRSRERWTRRWFETQPDHMKPYNCIDSSFFLMMNSMNTNRRKWFSKSADRASRSRTRQRPQQLAPTASIVYSDEMLSFSCEGPRQSDLMTPTANDRTSNGSPSETMTNNDAPRQVVPDSFAPPFDAQEDVRIMKAKQSHTNAENDSRAESIASGRIAGYQNRPTEGQLCPTLVPIAPGVYARLRGADETWSCIERDFYVPTVCFACTLELCCIQDADYVICPVCKVVSPLEGQCDFDHPNETNNKTEEQQSVGLGFTMDDLCQWQLDIISKRVHPSTPV